MRRLSSCGAVLALVACGSTPADAPPPRAAPPASAMTSPAGPEAPPEETLERRVIAVSDDARVLPIALGRIDDELTLLASAPSGLSRWAIDLEASRVAPRPELAPPEGSRAMLADFRDGRAWWVTPAERRTVWVERSHPTEPSQRTLLLSYQIARDDGLRTELRICPPAATSDLGAKATRCDHRIEAIAAIAGRLLAGGSIARGDGRTPWLGLIDEGGALRSEPSLAVEGALRGEVSAMTPGHGSVLVSGYERLGSSAQGWWVLLDDADLTRPLASALLPQRMAEAPWIVSAARPAGGHWLVFPHTSFDLRLVTVSAEGRIEHSQAIAETTAPSSSRQALFALDGLPWLVIAETGFGGRPQSLSLLAIDESTGEVVARHRAALTPGSFPHAIHRDHRMLLLANRLGTQTEVVAFDWPATHSSRATE